LIEGRWTIPDCWDWVCAGEIANVIGGGTPSTSDSSNFTKDGIPWLTPADLSNYKSTYIKRGARDISEKGLKTSSARILPKGTVLFTSRAPIGYCVIAANEISTNQGFKSFVLDGEISPEFVRHYLISAKDYAESLASGSTFKELSGKRVESLEIPLPPLNEQRRIVAKIEALKARSQKAKEALEAIPLLLDQFRQSVLAAAFRGDLTADWRKKNPQFTREWHKKLLDTARISITQTKQQGRLWGSGTSAQEVDKTWFKLPDTWNWTKVIDLGYDPDTVVQIGPMSMKSNEFTETGTTVLNVGCVQWDGLNLAKCNHLPPERASDFERYRIRKNDVLFTRSGAVGRSAIVTSEVDGALITFHLLRVRTSLNICLPEYLYFAFRGCNLVKAQIDASAIGATRAGFNTRLLQQIWLPLPPPEEQDQILQEIQKRFELIDTVAHRLNEINEYLKTLDQSILAKAFRGELVPQDPNEEPASVLLERIQAERAKREAEAKTAKKSTGKTTGQRSRKVKQQDSESTQLELPGLE